MDGGIDRRYVSYFGSQLELRIRDQISLRAEGYLPIGATIVAITAHERIPYVIVAPTMLMPEDVSADNSYRAMRAVLRTAAAHADQLGDVFCPGLGTGVGRVSPRAAAREMFAAYSDWIRSHSEV